MKYYFSVIWSLLFLLTGVSCNDDNEMMPEVNPEQSGTFVDTRDGYEYHWVRIGGLDWVTENAHYNTGNELNCTIYQPAEWDNQPETRTDMYLEKYGYLYTQSGALSAVPEGWRLPTDEDWKKLEMALGMSAEETHGLEWRGTFAGELMRQSGQGTMLGFQMSGYYMPYTTMATNPYRFMGVYGFFWTATEDDSKEGDCYYYRKLIYNSSQVYRQSMEPEANMLSVRFVRDAK